MKKFFNIFLISALFLFAGDAGAIKLIHVGSANTGVIYHRNITIDHTKAGSTDSSNFTVLVSASDTTLKTIANGGHVANSSGFDILFFSDAAFTTPLKWEVEFYSPTTGTLIAWVQIPTVSHTSDVTFYMDYGNTTISTFQGGATGAAWDSNFVAIYHLKDGTTLNVNDSTSNGNNATNHSATATTGVIDGAAAFSGTTRWIDTGKTSLWVMVGSQLNYTVEMVALTTASSGRQVLLADWNTSGLDLCYALEFGDSLGNYKIVSGINPANFQLLTSTTPAANTWYYIAGTGTTNSRIIYLNGASAATDTHALTAPTITDGTLVLGRAGALSSLYLQGKEDEVRISKTNRSADWLLTTYNSENSPGNIGAASFLTYGSEY